MTKDGLRYRRCSAFPPSNGQYSCVSMAIGPVGFSGSPQKKHLARPRVFLKSPKPGPGGPGRPVLVKPPGLCAGGRASGGQFAGPNWFDGFGGQNFTVLGKFVWFSFFWFRSCFLLPFQGLQRKVRIMMEQGVYVTI